MPLLELMKHLIIPVSVGASVGSMYFIASHYKTYGNRWVLVTMVVTTWMLGYSLGISVQPSNMGLFVSLVSSALGVVLLDSTIATIKEGNEPPPFLKWVVEVLRSIRGK